MVFPDICTRKCNCHQSCSGTGSSKSCHSICGTCTYPCYSSSYTLRYLAKTPDNQYNNYTNTIFYEKVGNYYTALKDLNYYKPIGKQISCYYFMNEPYKMVETPFHDVTFLVFAIIFFILAGIGYFSGVFGVFVSGDTTF